jgi:hypothetical protein
VARIRIIDEWLRSPVSEPSRRRAVVVVADSWSEQRVLMRAFAASADQTRPTISLRGEELAISPAGVDPHGPWGIHVEPPVDGRAQELREQLEEAARRLAGAKGRPPRLQDEEPAFERRPTNVWIPPSRAPEAPPPPEPAPTISEAARAPAPGRRRGLKETADLYPVRKAEQNARRASPPRAAAEPAPRGDPLASIVHRTMPLGFRLTAAEREVLNALGLRGELSAAEVAGLAGTGDGQVWMEALMAKLADHGLDLVVAGEGPGGAVFLLRR